MKTNTFVKYALFFSLTAHIGSAQTPVLRSKWLTLPPQTETQASTQKRSVAGLMAVLSAEKRTTSKDKVSLQDRLAVQQTLPGTWMMHITPEGTDAPPPFIVLGQFSWEGNFVSTESDLYLPPAGTPGQGVWAPASSRSFDLIQYAFLFDQGNLVGMTKIRAHGEFDQDGASFSGTYKIDFLDPDGVVQFSGAGSFDGVPVGVDPL